MRVKIFMDNNAKDLEKKVNNWLEDGLGTAEIVHIQTTATSVVEFRESIPCIIVTLWYEPPN